MKWNKKVLKFIVAGFCVSMFLFGLGCVGGGGSAFSIQLPEGEKYLDDADLWGFLNSEKYTRIDDSIETETMVLPGNPEEVFNLYYLWFFMSCFAENGFIITIEPDNPEEDIARFSVALHNRGMNWTEETLEFINQDPDNLFLVFNIMENLLTGGGMGLGLADATSIDIKIFAGGHYEKQEKEGMDEVVNQLYDMVDQQVPFPLWLVVTRQQFKEYMSQLVYKSEYVGGKEVTLTELLNMMIQPENWNDFEFMVRLQLQVPYDSEHPEYGTFPWGQEIIVSAHTCWMEENPENVISQSPLVKNEGGIIATEIEDRPEGETDIVHVNFVENFDANVFLDTEGGTGPGIGLDEITDLYFVKHILRNDGFRLIDTYNDNPPAFGAEDQILMVENFLGIDVGEPVEVPLIDEKLYVFTNMNLLNSPNLEGIYLKSITTDDPELQIWKNSEDPHNHGLNYDAIVEKLETAESYTYFYSDPSQPVTLQDILKNAGKSQEGELTFGVIIQLDNGHKIELRAGIFNVDYFTDVYDPVLTNNFFQQ